MRSLLIGGMALVLVCPSVGAALAGVPSEPETKSNPLVVALSTQGKEVVIQPSLDRLKSYGISAGQLEILRWRRLSEGDLSVEVEGKKINLADVATVSVRDLLTKSFTVDLLDGRKAMIVPDAKKIARYFVTGDYFELDVRQVVRGGFIENPAEDIVLRGVPVPGGHVPNAWGQDHIHISIGEPLRALAQVQISGKPGPQVADFA